MTEYLVDLTMLARMAMVSKGKILEIVNRGLLGVPEPTKVVKTITGRKFRYWERNRVKQWRWYMSIAEQIEPVFKEPREKPITVGAGNQG